MEITLRNIVYAFFVVLVVLFAISVIWPLVMILILGGLAFGGSYGLYRMWQKSFDPDYMSRKTSSKSNSKKPGVQSEKQQEDGWQIDSAEEAELV